jgi:tetratricopeptide (TPR) repeat protein
VYRVHEYLSLAKELTPTIIDVDITIHHSRGSTCIDPGRNIRILEAALAEYPRYLFYHGRECLDTGRFQDAIKSFNQYLECSTWKAETNEALMGIARAHVHLNDLESAKKFCLSVLVNDENFVPAYNLLGQIAQVQCRWPDAVKWYERCLDCSPTTYVFNDIPAVIFNTWGNLILCYHNTGDRSGVKKAIRESKKINPDSEWIQNNIKAVLNRGPNGTE